MFKRLKTILLPVAILAAVFGGASANAVTLPETRVGGYQIVDAASRQVETTQPTESQQASGFAWYDTASECSVAAKSPLSKIDDAVSARTPVGRQGQQTSFPNPSAPSPRNAPGTVSGRDYSGHAFDRMQERGLTPSVIEDTIQRGTSTAGRDGAKIFTTDQATVIVNPNGSVKTVW